MNSNQPFSEQYRIAAKDWVAKKAAADLLENSKSAFLSNLILKQEGPSVAAKELKAKASELWNEYVVEMSAARETANLAHVRVEWIRMQFWENQSANATNRKEMGM